MTPPRRLLRSLKRTTKTAPIATNNRRKRAKRERASTNPSRATHPRPPNATRNRRAHQRATNHPPTHQRMSSKRSFDNQNGRRLSRPPRSLAYTGSHAPWRLDRPRVSQAGGGVAPLARGPEPVGLAGWNFNFLDRASVESYNCGMALVPTTVILDLEKRRALRVLALRRGCSMSELVREAVDRILAEKGGALMYSSSVPSSLEVSRAES